ncbi:unnamed protein product [Chrysoparadoxa australica]
MLDNNASARNETSKPKAPKGKRSKKGKGRRGRGGDNDSDDNDVPDPLAGLKGAFDDSDEEEEEEKPGKKLTKKQKRRAEEAARRLKEQEEQEEEEEEEEEEEGGGDEPAAAAAAVEEEEQAVADDEDEDDDDNYDDYEVEKLAEAVEVVSVSDVKVATVDGDEEATELSKEERKRLRKLEKKRLKAEGTEEEQRAAKEERRRQRRLEKEQALAEEDEEARATKEERRRLRRLEKERKRAEEDAEAAAASLSSLSLGQVAAAIPGDAPVKSSAAPVKAAAETAPSDAAVTQVVEPEPGAAPPKKKMSKLEKKLLAAKKAKAAADAEAAKHVDHEQVKREEEARVAKEQEAEKARLAAEKEAKRRKKEKEQAMLEAVVDDDVYYGSDHETRDTQKAKAQTASLEEEFEAALAEAEAAGKKMTARARKKLKSELQAKHRHTEAERAEEIAHRDGAQFACSQTAVSADDQNWQNSLDVIIDAFTISAADKTLFKDASLSIVHGRKYGLVGPNGAGKSTLLKMIASKDLMIPPRVDTLYVEQEVVADETPAVLAVMKADKERWALVNEEKKLGMALKNDPENDKLNDRLRVVHERLSALGADDAEAKARRILFGLGFDEDMQVKPTKAFSGGWRMRISLARALFIEPTLLMLDEPTNHLDLNAVIWLDDYLQRWKKTILIVSHDQEFLNNVCQEILHLDSLLLNQYRGNYDTFKQMEATKRKQMIKEWEKQQKQIAQLKKAGSNKSKAEEHVKKAKSREPGAAAKKKKNAAVSSGQEARAATTLAERPREYVVTLRFPEVNQLTPPIIQVIDAEFQYETGPVIIEDMNFGIDMESRICIVGPNGAGKTTLLKLITGDLEPTKGEVRRNPRLRMGIYNQHFVDRLPMDIDPTSYLRQQFPDKCDYQSARNLLGKFGLEGHAHTIKMRDLSGGQKARVVFCDLQLQAPHLVPHLTLLSLSLPALFPHSNNLDIESIDALCVALNEFNGGVVVVTHDARLIEECDCRLWIVDEKKVTPWMEEFDDYKAFLLRQMEERLAAQEAKRASSQKS